MTQAEAIVLKILHPSNLANERKESLLKGKQITIGRGPENDIVIDHSSVSRQHATLAWINNSITISDLGSRNGTRLNDKLVVGTSPANIGDCIEVSDAKIILLKAEHVAEEEVVQTRSIDANQAVQARLTERTQIIQSSDLNPQKYQFSSIRNRPTTSVNKIFFFLFGAVLGAILALLLSKHIADIIT